MSDPKAIDELHARLEIEFLALDVLVNNAAIMRNLRLDEERGLKDVTREIDIDIRGPVQMVQRFLPGLLARDSALIVNVSSGLAFVPFPISPIYSAAKAAVHAYTRSLRVQLLATSVKVVELAPSGTETPLFRGEFEKEMAGQKAMAPAVLVRKTIADIERGKTEIRPGLSNVLYMMGRVAPGFMLRQLTKAGKERKKLERLSLTSGGNVRYHLKTPRRDGTTHVVFEPLDFIARLAALIPKPRVNLSRFHGVFAPNSRYRARVTPAGRGPGARRFAAEVEHSEASTEPEQRTRHDRDREDLRVPAALERFSGPHAEAREPCCHAPPPTSPLG